MITLWIFWGSCTAAFVGLLAWAWVQDVRRRARESHEHKVWMDGVAYGAGLDDRDKREALRKRLRLDQ